ncbi:MULTISPECIES: hypothetical protein [unclassified Bradyrhizobium]|uniref:hypothetical protein n=1 Tax=Bradyrhizobium TaxID=374 RepID=UPI0028F06B08|nr:MULTISPECIES: hypothetical protein [unclassified Bradyrhizobium]
MTDVVGALHLSRQIVDNLRQGAAITRSERLPQLPRTPENCGNEYDEGKPGDNQAYIPWNIISHTQLLPCKYLRDRPARSDESRDRLQSSVIRPLHLIRQITDDLRQRATIAGRQRRLNPTGAPCNGQDEHDQWQPGYDQTYVPRHIVIHTQPPRMVSARRTRGEAMILIIKKSAG